MFQHPDCNWLRTSAACLALVIAAGGNSSAQQRSPTRFHLQEASIDDIQRAILANRITTVGLVELYLKRMTKRSCFASPRLSKRQPGIAGRRQSSARSLANHNGVAVPYTRHPDNHIHRQSVC